MAARLRPRLRAPATFVAALLTAAAAVAGVLLVQREAADKTRAAELVAQLAVEVHRQESLAENALRPGARARQRALERARAHAGELLERAIDLGGDDDLRPMRVLMADYELAVDAEAELGGRDLRLRRTLHERRVEPAFDRLVGELGRMSLRERTEADGESAEANAESAIALAAALLLAGLLLWRFGVARRELGRLSRRTEIEAVERAAARESEQALRFQAQLLDQVDAAVVATDLDGVITHWNRGAAELLGWTAEQVRGKRVDALGAYGKSSLPSIPDVLRRLAGGASWDHELRLDRRDGSRFDAYLTATPIRDESGEPLGLVGVAVDISERKQAATELARRAEQQAAVAELGRLAMTGTGVEELMGRAVQTLSQMLDAQHPAVMELLPGGREVVLRAAAPEDRSLVGTLTLPVRQDNLSGYVLGSSEPVVAPDLSRETRFAVSPLMVERGVRSGMATVIEGKDGPFGLLAVHTTEAHHFSTDDVNFLRAVANVLSAAVTREREEQLEEQLQRARRLESVGQLAGGVAHDFNNLLAVILNFAQFALDAAEQDTTMREDLEEIRRAAERAAELTHQLLVFSRREPVDTHVVDVNETLAAVEGMLRRTIGEHIELRSERAGGLWEIRANSGQMEQVLLNLAVNARDAMPDGGRLTIRTENAEAAPADLPAGRWVRLVVGDTGTGMAPEVASQAFDPFFTTKPKSKGTGLGLASVYGIVSHAGGEVTIDSRLGEGTTVSIWLPATEDTLGWEPPEPDESPIGHGESILVVEDEDQVRALTTRILSEHGYAVTEADGGLEALATCANSSEPIDLLVTDVVMPGMSGAELAERLLADRPDMKVLYMSGYTGDALLRHGPRERDVAVLEKPFSADLLLRRVRESLEASVTL